MQQKNHLHNKCNYIGGKHASKILGVHQRTLYQWDIKKKIDTIRTPGGKRLYNVEKYLKQQECIKNGKIFEENNVDNIKMNIIYARVSSKGQSEDLERQKKLLIEKYPNHTLIEDIGSGMNLNKRGIRKIIDYAIAGKINEVVVAYKDRLARFGFELIESLIKKYSNGTIIILNKQKDMTPQEEIAYDVLQIMNIFTAKINGSRKYEKKKKEKNNNNDKI